jgi:predicted acyltransferase
MLTRRNAAIDVFRGLVMLLMVFVNDFWTVGDVPHFLEHFDTFEDGMGLSDVVFPMFLFAMGMSIPYAIESRFSKGYSGESTLGHILSRTFALLLMGVFIVNSEGGFDSTLGYGLGIYRILMVFAFFLIWNAYPKGFKAKGWLQLSGAVILAFLAITFRTPEDGFFRAGWWGILGLIGWAYMFCSIAYLLLRKKPQYLPLVWVSLILVNIFVTRCRGGELLTGGPTFVNDMAGALNLGNGSSAIMAMGGILVSLAEKSISYLRCRDRIVAAMAASVVLFFAAMLSHRFWIVSKNLGTLPWCLYVSALSLVFYALLRAMEAYGRLSWFSPFRYSGLATLTVYMIPYVLYSIRGFLGYSSPEWLAGPLGLLKCALFSLLCLAITTGLVKCGCKLKV